MESISWLEKTINNIDDHEINVMLAATKSRRGNILGHYNFMKNIIDRKIEEKNPNSTLVLPRRQMLS